MCGLTGIFIKQRSLKNFDINFLIKKMNQKFHTEVQMIVEFM